MSLLRTGSSLANFATSSSSAYCRYAARPTAALHTSAIAFAESQKQRVARIVRKTNIEKKAERARHYEENKPHVILGTRPRQEETKWRSCDLAKILVTPEGLNSLPPTPTHASGTDVQMPKYVGYGLDGLDGTDGHDKPEDFFFNTLPKSSATVELECNRDLGDKIRARHIQNLSLEEKRVALDKQKKEADKAQHLARLADLRNANARGIAFENRRRIIAAFSPTGNPADSGYPEVQVALLTMKIRNIWDHLMQRKKDIHSRRSLRLLVHQRAKMLKYIKRIDRDRYDKILERAGLEPGAVEGELVV